MTLTLKKPLTNPYLDAFRAHEPLLPGGEAAWLTALREQAIDAFHQTGFPTRRTEEWRYTRLGDLNSDLFTPGRKALDGLNTCEASLALEGTHPRLVFVNGYLDTMVSRLHNLPEGLEIQQLGATPENRQSLEPLFQSHADAVAAIKNLNTAFLMDGAVITLAANARIETPIEIMHVMTDEAAARAAHLHHVIRAGANSSATFLETYAGAGRYWTNIVWDVALEAGAKITSCKIEQESPEALHLAQTDVRISSHARYVNFSLLTGGQTVRNEINVTFAGEKADCRLSGAYLARHGQSHEVATLVDHATPDNVSVQAYNGVLDGGAHTAFQGRVIVRPDAQRTNADQTNHNLVLARAADANSKPELEIYADDVKCSHGSTVGEIDPNMMFYLMTRGLDETAARNLLVEAFVGGIIDGVERADIQDKARHIAAQWLSRPRDKM